MASVRAILFICLVAFSVLNADAGQNWYNFKVRFDLLPFKGFYDMPRTLAEAEKDDWILIEDGCAEGASGRYLGKRMMKNNVEFNEMIIIYDGQGYIAGTQSVVPKAFTHKEVFDFDKSKFYNLEKIKGEEVYLTTAYFIDTEFICSGREPEVFDLQGTGTNLYFQTGPTYKDLIQAPYNQQSVQLNPDRWGMWYEHYCFINMGNHYFTIDPENSENMSCQEIYPIQLVFDHQPHNELIGFVWQHFANVPGDLWERPDTKAVNAIVHNAPPCMLQHAEEKNTVTLHHYFKDWVETCLFG